MATPIIMSLKYEVCGGGCVCVCVQAGLIFGGSQRSLQINDVVQSASVFLLMRVFLQPHEIKLVSRSASDDR